MTIVRVQKKKNARSAVDFRNVSENFGAEILNNLNSVKNVGHQCLRISYPRRQANV